MSIGSGYTTSSAEPAPHYGPTAIERLQAYENTHPNRYFVAPAKSESKGMGVLGATPGGERRAHRQAHRPAPSREVA
jgi:hypothetical protein